MSDTFYVIGEDTATDIADSIRTKKGYSSDHKLKVEDFAGEIESTSTTIDELFYTSVPNDSVDLIGYGEGTINNSAFYQNAKIKSIYFPNITETGESSFSGCSNLKSINLPSLQIVGKQSFINDSSLTEANLPEVITVKTYGFSGAKLTSLNFSKITTIESSGFAGNNFTNVELTECTSLSDQAFSGNTNLQTFSAPKITTLNGQTFNNCSSLTSLNIPNVKTVNNRAFANCKNLSRVNSEIEGEFNFPEATTFNATSGNAYIMFEGGNTNLKKLKLPKLTAGGQYNFQGLTALEEVELPLLTYIPGRFFNGCSSLSKINSEVSGEFYLPKIGSISVSGFQGCASASKIYLPNLSSLQGEGYQFSGCSNLEIIDFGASFPGFYSGNSHCLQNCPSLHTLIFRKQGAVSYSNIFTGTTDKSKITIYVPSEYVASYEADANWSTAGFAGFAAITDSITINSDTYTCIDGETWASWVDSANNTDDYVIVGNIITDSTKTNYITQNGNAVLPGQVINGTAYDLTPINS